MRKDLGRTLRWRSQTGWALVVTLLWPAAALAGKRFAASVTIEPSTFCVGCTAKITVTAGGVNEQGGGPWTLCYVETLGQFSETPAGPACLVAGQVDSGCPSPAPACAPDCTEGSCGTSCGPHCRLFTAAPEEEKTFWVKGERADYGRIRAHGWRLVYRDGVESYDWFEDTVEFTVVQLDLSVVGLDEEDENQPPGQYIGENDDFDEQNDDEDDRTAAPTRSVPVPPYEQVWFEWGDMIPLTLSVQPQDDEVWSTIPTHLVSDSSKLRIYARDSAAPEPLSVPPEDPTDYYVVVSSLSNLSCDYLVTTGSRYGWTFFVEGNEPGLTTLSFDATQSSNPARSCGDFMLFTVVKVDADVDSDNTAAQPPYEPDGTYDEDSIEEKPDLPGRYVSLNNDDDDNDGVVDNVDGWNADGTGGNDDDRTWSVATGKGEDDFVMLRVSIAEPVDPEVAYLAISYVAYPPEGTVPPDARIRIWKRPGDQARDKRSAADGGDYVAPGTYQNLGQLTPSGTPQRSMELFIEGVRTSAAKGDCVITVSVDPDGPGPAGVVHSDAARMTVIAIDADIDSDNTNALDPPDRSSDEDTIENRIGVPDMPGKFVEVNHNDDDNDCVPDFADGFNLDGTAGNADDVCAGEAFVPLVLEVPAPLDPSQVRIRLTYDASDPASVIRSPTEPNYAYTPPSSGRARLWAKGGSDARNKASRRVNPSGDYIEPGEYAATALGFSGETTTRTLYLEGVAASADCADVEIKVEADPDGDGPIGWVVVDSVRATVVMVDIDIDSDNNDAIEDVDDPIEAKTPGCIIPKDLEGDTDEGVTPVKDALEQVKLAAAPTIALGKLELTAAPGVKIWTDKTKTTEVVLPKTYDPPSTLPATLYVDGVAKGSKPAITLAYKDRNSLQVGSDKIQVLVTETPSWAPAKAGTAYIWASLKTWSNNNDGNNLGWGDADEFVTQIKDQGWPSVTWYEDLTGDTDTDFGSCTLSNYTGMKDCGIFTVVSHGEIGAHVAVYAVNSPAGSAAIDSWIGSETGITKSFWITPPSDPDYPKFAAGCYVAEVSASWLASHWATTLNKNKAIAMWSICYSASGSPSVRDGAGGRWRSGYERPTDLAEATAVNKKFLERMNGTTDAQKRRTAGEAWDGGTGYYVNPRYHVVNAKMAGNKWTTLCPSPMADDPVFPDVGPGPRFGWGCIVFDTYMKDDIAATSALVRVVGGPTSDHRWGKETADSGGTKFGRFFLGFDYDKTSAAATTMRAVADHCKNKDPNGGRELDGDRQTPHKDNKEWSY